MSSKKKLNNVLPELNSGDFREGYEFLRATMTLLRQSYSIIWMRKTAFNDITDTEIKDFTESFDKVNRMLYASHRALYDKFVELSKYNDNGVSSSDN